MRRSFGERWSTKIMPQVLKELMRHEDIATTMRYYVGRNAQNIAKALWGAVGKAGKSTAAGTSSPNAPVGGSFECGVNPDGQTA